MVDLIAEQRLAAGRVLVLNVVLVSSLLAAPVPTSSPMPAGLLSAMEEYRHAVEPEGEGYRAANHRQNFNLRFNKAAVSVQLPAGEVRLRLVGYGRGGQMRPPGAAALTAARNRVTYRREFLTEWYVNDAQGLEQGFTLENCPAGEGPIVLTLLVEGGLTPRLESSAGVLLERNGMAVLRYSGLKAWDARGRSLVAGIEVAGSEVRLRVQDIGAVYPVVIDPWLQVAKLTASDRSSYAFFGGCLALSGGTAVVGASAASSDTGAAYVFVRSGTTWTQEAKLTASNGVPNDSFGSSVALRGNTAIVGAVGVAGNAGAAYVFVRKGTVWTQQAVLTASDGAGFDKFGSSVALNGGTALVGAFWKASQTGAAYVFVRNGTVWTQQAKLEASDGALSDRFGVSVALSGDTALVGAYGQANYSGAAYVYVRGGTAWTQQAKLTRTGRAVQDYFGASVALSNDTALIGAYGHALRTGAAHIYIRSGTVWTHRAILTASDGNQYDSFGYS
jgi:hypothetical protein